MDTFVENETVIPADEKACRNFLGVPSSETYGSPRMHVELEEEGLAVFAMPMLLDTEVDFVTAMIESTRAVLASPLPMLGWGVVVTTMTMIAMVPLFLGLLVVLPVLGHATWHLYALAASRKPA